MENLPPFIRWYAEKAGKDVTAFTLDDWRNLAFEAAAEVQALNRELSIIEKKLPPPPGKPGRPRKHPTKPKNMRFIGGANVLHPENWEEVKPRRGRPIATYYGFPVEFYAELLDEIGTSPKAPRQTRACLSLVLKSVRARVGGYVDPRTIERALRKFRAETNKKKPT